MLSATAASLLACVRYEGLPDARAAQDAADLDLYNSSARAWDARVKRARALVRKPANRRLTNFTLSDTDGTGLASAGEVRRLFGGAVLIGDSQVRELAWSVLKALTPADELRFGDDRAQTFSEGKSEAAQLRSRRRLRGACLPQTVGKLGFTAVCYRGGGSDAAGGGCRLFSPFGNGSYMEKMKQLWLFRCAAAPIRGEA
jgi:hypothetical protein